MNTEHSSEGLRICSGTLAKYVIEKWRSALPGLSLSLRRNRAAKQHYRTKTVKKYLLHLASYSK